MNTSPFPQQAANQIQRLAWKLAVNPELVMVYHSIQEGWPEEVRDELKPYWSRRLELSVLDGCILWGNRVVIPLPGRNGLLAELHGGHPGVSHPCQGISVVATLGLGHREYGETCSAPIVNNASPHLWWPQCSRGS